MADDTERPDAHNNIDRKDNERGIVIKLLKNRLRSFVKIYR